VAFIAIILGGWRPERHTEAESSPISFWDVARFPHDCPRRLARLAGSDNAAAGSGNCARHAVSRASGAVFQGGEALRARSTRGEALDVLDGARGFRAAAAEGCRPGDVVAF